MARGSGRWAPYVPVAERRRKAEREMNKLRGKGHPVAPVTITGRAIATTFWGKAWCDNLESYRDYENRLPRGRTYVRNGSVVDLQIAPRTITALVSGSEIYRVTVTIAAVPAAQWQAICRDCAGGIDSLVELLQGRLSKGVMERLCRQDNGLFPKPTEIKLRCSCPDSASLCKHLAAVLYGVGARLDHQPELLFRLRAVDEKDLVANLDVALPAAALTPTPGRILEADDVSALFGLEMLDSPAADNTSAAQTTPQTSVAAQSRVNAANQQQTAPARRGRPTAKSTTEPAPLTGDAPPDRPQAPKRSNKSAPESARSSAQPSAKTAAGPARATRSPAKSITGQAPTAASPQPNKPPAAKRTAKAAPEGAGTDGETAEKPARSGRTPVKPAIGRTPAATNPQPARPASVKPASKTTPEHAGPNDRTAAAPARRGRPGAAAT